MTEPTRKRLSDTTADRIKSDISAGVWGPGVKLPTTVELAERYGVSTRTIEQAMADLVDDGVVIGRQGGRRYVPGAPPEDTTGEIGQSEGDEGQP